MSVNIEHLGCAGHLIVSSMCRWHRHTQIFGPGGAFRISTIGNYFPPKSKEREPLGAGPSSYFETMVFPISTQAEPDSEGCGCCSVTDWGGLDCERYSTPGEAQRGHEWMIERYAAIADNPE